MDRKFKIDFFELVFLAQACIPPVPIARAMFFDDLSKVYYKDMTQSERDRMFEFVVREERFNMKDEDCAHFHSRFNPDNQYNIVTNFEGNKEELEVYKHKGRYHFSKTGSVVEKFIEKVEKNVG